MREPTFHILVAADAARFPPEDRLTARLEGASASKSGTYAVSSDAGATGPY